MISDDLASYGEESKMTSCLLGYKIDVNKVILPW